MMAAPEKTAKQAAQPKDALTSGRPITTAAVLSPNQWEGLNRLKFERGRGTTISSLLREAVEQTYGFKDEVASPGSYDRSEARQRRED